MPYKEPSALDLAREAERLITGINSTLAAVLRREGENRETRNAPERP